MLPGGAGSEPLPEPAQTRPYPRRAPATSAHSALGGLRCSPRQAVPDSVSSSLSGRRACQGLGQLCCPQTGYGPWGCSQDRGGLGSPAGSPGPFPRPHRWLQAVVICGVLAVTLLSWGPSSKSLSCSGVSFWSPLTGGDLQSLPARVPGGGLVQGRRVCPPQAAFPSVERRTVPLGDLVGCPCRAAFVTHAGSSHVFWQSINRCFC